MLRHPPATRSKLFVAHRHELTDAQWNTLVQALPKRQGPESMMGDRAFINANLYRARTGCAARWESRRGPNPLMNIAYGGVKVRVNENEFERANQLLAELDDLSRDADPDDEADSSQLASAPSDDEKRVRRAQAAALRKRLGPRGWGLRR
jgi:hypothetical protein